MDLQIVTIECKWHPQRYLTSKIQKQKGDYKTHTNSTKNVLVSAKNPRKISVANLRECRGGRSANPGASRERTSDLMISFGTPSGPHFEGSSHSGSDLKRL